MLEKAIHFILQNKEWLFSGLGIAMVSAILFIIRNKRSNESKIVVTEKTIKVQSNNIADGNITNVNVKGNIKIKH